MHIRDLEEFRDSVANPRMEQLIESTQIPEGACYINQLEVSFLDGRSCGQESLIEATGLLYQDGKVEKYHFSELDIGMDEFLAKHEGAVFVAGGSLHITDELEQMDLRTNLGNSRECGKLFPQMSYTQEMIVEDTPLSFEKMKHLLQTQQKELPDRGGSLDALVKKAREKASEKNAEHKPASMNRGSDLER